MKLILYDKACAALAAAKGVDEAKKIHDTAEAMRAYARQAKNRELEVDAAEIRIRAERRVGELIAVQKALPRERGGGLARGNPRPTGSKRVPVAPPITLSELGIDKKLSARAQQLAAVPERSFEKQIGDWRARVQKETERITTNLVREGARRQREEVSTPTETVTELGRLAGRRFATVYADPPWAYGNQGTRAATDHHYPTMTAAEIAALPVREVVAEDAHLHLWTTNAFLFDARVVMEAWGFEYKSCFVWVKPQMGIGNYWRVSHEFLLFGVRGNAPFSDHGLMSWASFDRTGHSRKPEQVRFMVERASPAPRLELFGRRVSEGWTVLAMRSAADSSTLRPRTSRYEQLRAMQRHWRQWRRPRRPLAEAPGRHL